MEQSLCGKEIAAGTLGNSPHKFVWYNRSHEEFATLVAGKTIGKPRLMGRWLALDLDPGYRLIFGELGGKIILHSQDNPVPQKYHLLLRFTDQTFLSVLISMWGALELYQKGEELSRDYIRDMAITPLDQAFTQEYFTSLLQQITRKGKRSVKSLLTQEQTIPGLGNSIAQDIMFTAGLNPRRNLQELGEKEQEKLFRSIRETLEEVIRLGGRYDEVDLYGKAGGYVRKMDAKSAGKPCPICQTAIKSMQYLGGACYYCPNCQK